MGRVQDRNVMENDVFISLERIRNRIEVYYFLFYRCISLPKICITKLTPFADALQFLVTSKSKTRETTELRNYVQNI